MRPVDVLRALPCAALLLVGLSARAQDERGPAPNVEVSAYRVPMTLQETTQGASLIDRQDIEARKPTSIFDLLQPLPGVHVDQLGPGGVSNIYIRGSDPEQVLVLIDGVRVNDPMLSRGGSYDISSIDPAMVERIEVLRGAGSAIYGADGVSGVVNFRLQKHFEGASLRGQAGTSGYGDGTNRFAALTLGHNFADDRANAQMLMTIDPAFAASVAAGGRCECVSTSRRWASMRTSPHTLSRAPSAAVIDRARGRAV